MNNLGSSVEYFIGFLEKCIRHFNILKCNYSEFEDEFSKIRAFVNQSDSKILRRKFGFLLMNHGEISEASDLSNLNLALNDIPETGTIDSSNLKVQLRILKQITLMAIHISKVNQTSICSPISDSKWGSKGTSGPGQSISRESF